MTLLPIAALSKKPSTLSRVPAVRFCGPSATRARRFAGEKTATQRDWAKNCSHPSLDVIQMAVTTLFTVDKERNWTSRWPTFIGTLSGSSRHTSPRLIVTRVIDASGVTKCQYGLERSSGYSAASMSALSGRPAATERQRPLSGSKEGCGRARGARRHAMARRVFRWVAGRQPRPWA